MAQPAPVCAKTPQPPFHPKFFPYPAMRYPQLRPSLLPDSMSHPQSDGVCQVCSVKHAPFYVCLIELAFMGSVLALYVQHYMAQELQTTMLTVTFTSALLSAVVGVCLILSLGVGLCLESSTLLVPHMIGQIVGICIMTVIGALTLLFTFTGVEYPRSLGPDFGTVFLAIAVLCLAMALAEVWFFFLIRDAYIHLKRKEDEREMMLNPPPPPPPPPPPADAREPNSGVPEDPAEHNAGAETTEEEEPADPATLQRWWAEYFENQRKQKKLTGGAWAFPPPPSETENQRPETNNDSIVIEPVLEEGIE